jgi:antitoxin component YwqK of YwqJK toxin-antitoxin module
MSKRKKIVLSILLILVLTVGGFIAYIMLQESKNRNPFTAIPDDAVYIIETTNLTEGWTKISDSKMWNHMKTNKHFADISKSAATLDSLIKGNETMDMLFSDRQLLVSAHMISGNDYDFVFVVNMKQASKITFIKDYIQGIVGTFGYTMNKRTFEGNEIIELTDNKTLEVLYITFIDNLFVGSYSPVLIEKSLKQKDNGNWTKNSTFRAVSDEISSKKLFNFYFNYSLLSKYMACYLTEESDIVNSLTESLRFSAFNVNFENERLNFSGYTNVNDSISSYAKALVGVSPGELSADKIISDKAALYFSLGFSDFNEFFKNLQTEFADEKTKDYESYSNNISKIEKFFKVDLKTDFFNNIGNEIAFVKLKPVANAKEDDIAVLIHTNDIENAQKGLDHLAKQVKRKSPVKFDTIVYKNHPINYLNIKGFFKMFFGKLFGKLQKPYYTYIDNFIVFSNSPSTLMDIIDDKLAGKTLSENKEFTDFKSNFNSKANVSVFVRMPEMYSHLYYYSKPEKRNGIHENKDLILSFSEIGFQITSDGKMFKTLLIVDHDEDVLANEELEQFEAAAEELFNEDFELLNFKISLEGSDISENGIYKKKYDNGKTVYEGMTSEKKPDGVWRSYYESGNLMSIVNYRNGKVEGEAAFYYDNEDQLIKAKMVFIDEKISGEYTEYYESGSKKALLEYEDGKANGDAEFYYDGGKIKIQGKFKDGERTGKWNYFTEVGEAFNKEKWKKGAAKKTSKTNE